VEIMVSAALSPPMKLRRLPARAAPGLVAHEQEHRAAGEDAGVLEVARDGELGGGGVGERADGLAEQGVVGEGADGLDGGGLEAEVARLHARDHGGVALARGEVGGGRLLFDVGLEHDVDALVGLGGELHLLRRAEGRAGGAHGVVDADHTLFGVGRRGGGGRGEEGGVGGEDERTHGGLPAGARV
jgi:hypothetical protein